MRVIKNTLILCWTLTWLVAFAGSMMLPLHQRGIQMATDEHPGAIASASRYGDPGPAFVQERASSDQRVVPLDIVVPPSTHVTSVRKFVIEDETGTSVFTFLSSHLLYTQVAASAL